jgi:hypothetical protein
MFNKLCDIYSVLKYQIIVVPNEIVMIQVSEAYEFTSSSVDEENKGEEVANRLLCCYCIYNFQT